MLATRNHTRQSPQARLAGGAKSYLGKQELILKNIHRTQQDQPLQEARQKLRDYLSLSETDKAASWKETSTCRRFYDKPIFKTIGDLDIQ